MSLIVSKVPISLLARLATHLLGFCIASVTLLQFSLQMKNPYVREFNAQAQFFRVLCFSAVSNQMLYRVLEILNLSGNNEGKVLWKLVNIFY